MGLWDRIAAPFRRAPVESIEDAVRPDDPQRYQLVLSQVAPAGVTVTMDSVFELSAAWACICALTNGIATSPWNVYAVDGDARNQLPNDPLAYLLNTRPNPDMTAVAFKEAMMFHALTWGNGFAEIVRDLAGRVVQLWPLMSNRMQMRRDDDGALVYDYYQQDGGTIRLEQRNVYHLRGPGITGLMGDNLVARAAKSMGLAAAQECFASTYFGNNTILGGFLKYPKTLDDKTFKHLRESWEDRFRGPKKSNKPAILEGGTEWVPLTNNAEGAQLEQSRKFQLEEICRWFGVPPHKIQHLDRATFNNIEHLAIEFVRDGVTPWKVRAEQEADYKLFASRSIARKTEIDVSKLTQGDFKSRAEGYQVMRRIGVYSVNDIRRMEGQNSIGPEGDVRIVESNMQTIDQLTAMKDPEIYDYHIKAGIPTLNEVRARLHLPKVAGGDKPANQLNPGQDAESHDHTTKVEPTTPAFPPTEEKKALPPKTNPSDLIHGAASALFASVFDRYSSHMVSREAELTRLGCERGQVRAALADERARMRSSLVDDAREAIDLVMKLRGPYLGSDRKPYEVFFLLAVDNVDQGVTPRDAADRMVTNLLYGTTTLEVLA